VIVIIIRGAGAGVRVETTRLTPKEAPEKAPTSNNLHKQRTTRKRRRRPRDTVSLGHPSPTKTAAVTNRIRRNSQEEEEETVIWDPIEIYSRRNERKWRANDNLVWRRPATDVIVEERTMVVARRRRDGSERCTRWNGMEGNGVGFRGDIIMHIEVNSYYASI